MTTPLERAARAVCRLRCAGMETNWHLYVPDVEAVLQAIREPSAKMSRAGHLRAREFDAELGSSYQTADQTFAAMIDAALEEGL